MEQKKRPVEEEYVCRHFIRTSSSLIEEPEVCEWCEFYDEGYCCKESE